MKRINKLLYLVLTFFFGSIGIKDLITKNYKAVVARFLFLWTGIPTLLGLVDFITILTEKADKDKTVAVISNRVTKVRFAVLAVIFTLFVIGSTIPWETLIKTTVFSDFNTTLGSLVIGEYSLFGNLIGTPKMVDPYYGSSGVVPAFGNFAYIDMAIILIALSGIFAFVNKIKFDDFVDNASEKIKKALPTAVFAVLVSIVLVIFVTTGVHTTIVNAILGLAKKFNLALSLLASLVGGTLIGNTYYFIGTTSQVFSIAAGAEKYYGVLAHIIQSIGNLVLLIAPTSVALMAGLHAMEIPYTKWLKHIWKLFLILLGIVIVSTVILYVLV